MKPSISVVVCCHNSAQRLVPTLAHLADQQVPSDLDWELLVVDNASTDNTARCAREHWTADGLPPLQIVSEPRLGKMYGFQRALAQARYPLVSFLDDDNWIAPDWIVRVMALMQEHPEVGACGGRTEPVFESPPPAWLDSIREAYALGEQAPAAGDITCTRGYFWGAGLSIRKKAWDDLVAGGFCLRLTCRKGDKLTAGGDSEVCQALRLAGWRLWYDPTLLLQHWIPTSRLNWSYARRLFRGFGASEPVLSAYDKAARNDWSFHSGRLLRRRWQKDAWRVQRILTAKRGALLRQLISGQEGSFEVLRAERLLGELQDLLRSRGRIDRLYQDLRQATWRVACTPRSASDCN